MIDDGNDMYPISRIPKFATMALGLLATTLDAGAASPFSATATVASQYVARGVRQSWDRPALQGSIDYASDNGWTAGIWGSSIDDRFVENGRVELDLYAGYAAKLGELGYSTTLTWYRYPGARVSSLDIGYDYGELAAGLSWKMLSAKYSYTFSRDFFGIPDARGTGYLDLGAEHDLGHAVSLQLHAGDGRVAGAGNSIWNWRDLRAGLSKKFDDGWTVALNYTRAYGATGAYERYTTGIPRADGRPAVSNVARRALVLSLSRSF